MQIGCALKVPQSLCIWATDIDCKVVGLIGQCTKTGHIIIHGLFERCDFSFTNIYSHGHFSFTFRVILR